MMKGQQEKLEDLKQFADTLIADSHYAQNEITDCYQEVEDRDKKFWDNCEARRHKLEDSKNYQVFLRNLYEVIYSIIISEYIGRRHVDALNFK